MKQEDLIRLKHPRLILIPLLILLLTTLLQLPARSLASPSAGTSAGANMLRNGGFEQDLNADGKPDSWTASAYVSRSALAAHTGTFGLRHATTLDRDYMISQSVQDIRPGRRYRLSTWTSIPATSDSFTYRIQITWRSQSAIISTVTLKAHTTSTAGWVNNAAIYLAPAGASTAVVKMVVSSLKGVIHADDFVFSYVPDPTPTRTRTSSATSTLTRTATGVATETFTPSPSATSSETATATKTETSTPTATETSTPTASTTATETETSTPTATETSTPDPTSTFTPTPTQTAGCQLRDHVYPFIINSVDYPHDTPSGTVKQITLATANSAIPPGSFGWASWNIDGNPAGPGSSANLERSLAVPGNLGEGFNEGPSPNTNGPQPGVLEVGDWLLQASGVSTSITVSTRLSSLATGNAGGPYDMVLPVVSSSTGTGSNIVYRVSRLGRFQLAAHALPRSINLRYLGEAGSDTCQPEPSATPSPTTTPQGITLSGSVDELILSRKFTEQTMDIVIVYDLSSSMKFGLTSNQAVPAGQRRLDVAAPAVRGFIDKLLAYPGAPAEIPDEMIAVVTFAGSSNTARVVSSWGDYTQRTALRNAIPTDGAAYGGNTPTPAGLKLAQDTLAARPGTRSVQVADPTQPSGYRMVSKKVHKVLVLVTDGAANVMLGRTNLNCTTGAPADCGDNPFYQRTYANGVVDPPNSPIGKSVSLANEIKAAGAEVFALGFSLGVNGYTATDMRLDQMVSPPVDSHLYTVSSHAQASAAFDAITQLLNSTRCMVIQDPPRDASGARARLYDAQSGELLSSASADAQGRYAFAQLQDDRSYTLVIDHLGMVGPDQVARNYSWMTSYGGTEAGPLSRYIPPGSPGTIELPEVALSIERVLVDGEWLPPDPCAP